MDPLQILVLKVSAFLFTAALAGLLALWLLLPLARALARRVAARRELRARRRYAARCRRVAEQPTQVLARYEQEMRPLSDFYVFDDDGFPINHQHQYRRTR